MKLNAKGQVTIPADLRRKRGFLEGDEFEVIADGEALRIIHATPAASRSKLLVNRIRGRATTRQSTDDLMRILRDAGRDVMSP